MMDFLAREALSPELANALDRYWNAKNHAEERSAYFDALAHGQPPSYGEDWARAEPIAVEWLSFMPGAPIFAIIPDEFPPAMRMLVEYGDG